MTLLSERGKSNKTNANKVLYEASYEAPLTRKTRLKFTATASDTAKSISRISNEDDLSNYLSKKVFHFISYHKIIDIKHQIGKIC